MDSFSSLLINPEEWELKNFGLGTDTGKSAGLWKCVEFFQFIAVWKYFLAICIFCFWIFCCLSRAQVCDFTRRLPGQIWPSNYVIPTSGLGPQWWSWGVPRAIKNCTGMTGWRNGNRDGVFLNPLGSRKLKMSKGTGEPTWTTGVLKSGAVSEILAIWDMECFIWHQAFWKQMGLACLKEGKIF